MSETTENARDAIEASGLQTRSFWAAMDRREIPCSRGARGGLTWDLGELARLRRATSHVSYQEALGRVMGTGTKPKRSLWSRLWRRS